MKHVRTIDVAGTPVAVLAPPGEWTEAAAAATRGLADHPEGPTGWLRLGEAVAIPGSLSHVEADGQRLWGGCDVPVAITASGALSLGPGPVARIDARPGLACMAARELVATALAWLLMPSEIWMVHAAGIVLEPGAALVPGHTGAGKSTAAAAAIAADRQVLGDDLAAVRLGRAGPEISGIARPLTAPPEFVTPLGTEPATPAVRALAGVPMPDDRRGRFELAGVTLATGWWPLAAVAALEHSSEPQSEVAATDPHDALRSLWNTALLGWVRTVRQAWFPVAAELSRLPAFRLRLGADPGRRLVSTAEALTALDARVRATSIV